MKLSKEINLLIIGSMIILWALCSGVSIYTLRSNSMAEMDHLKELLITERKKNLRDMVLGAYSVVATANFYEPAQNALHDMRFGEGRVNYFFVVDGDGMFWVNPVQPGFVGKVKIDITDAEGIPYIRKIIQDAGSSGEGFINYKEGSGPGDIYETRLVHYKIFEKWNWIICADMGISDIDNVLAAKEKEIHGAMVTQFLQISGLLVVALLLTTFISSRLVSKRVVKPLMQIKHAAERIGQGDFGNNLEVRGGLEMRQLAKSINSMQVSLDIALKMTRKMQEQNKIVPLKGNSSQNSPRPRKKDFSPGSFPADRISKAS
ncbi:MAG: cache domain-containing protein [Desulfamplus sp.]|nr:cache domain-containing protein [Desulfamplus sp.]